MGNQQNPDGIYVPPGVNKRYPLSSDGKIDLEKCSDAQINELKRKAIDRLQQRRIDAANERNRREWEEMHPEDGS